MSNHAYFCDSFVSCTSDMGTEMAVPDFDIDDVDSLVPPWMQRGVGSLDIEPETKPDTNPHEAARCRKRRKTLKHSGGG